MDQIYWIFILDESRWNWILLVNFGSHCVSWFTSTVQIDRILKSLGNLFSFKTSAMTAPNACTKSLQNEAEDPSESRICADQWELANQIQSKYDLYISAHSSRTSWISVKIPENTNASRTHRPLPQALGLGEVTVVWDSCRYGSNKEQVWQLASRDVKSIHCTNRKFPIFPTYISYVLHGTVVIGFQETCVPFRHKHVCPIIWAFPRTNLKTMVLVTGWVCL